MIDAGVPPIATDNGQAIEWRARQVVARARKRRRLGRSDEIPAIALPCGTALDINHELLGLLRSGDGGGGMGAGWREFLALHGV